MRILTSGNEIIIEVEGKYTHYYTVDEIDGVLYPISCPELNGFKEIYDDEASLWHEVHLILENAVYTVTGSFWKPYEYLEEDELPKTISRCPNCGRYHGYDTPIVIVPSEYVGIVEKRLEEVGYGLKREVLHQSPVWTVMRLADLQDMADAGIYENFAKRFRKGWLYSDE